jgi:hypothetical protein
VPKRASSHRSGSRFQLFSTLEAKIVETEISYGDEYLKICVRDDGRGIDESVIRNGHLPGHLGLVGMHERASRITAKYTIWSKRNAETEIVVEVPSRFAYVAPQGRSVSWISKLLGMQNRRFEKMTDINKIRVLIVDDHPLMRSGITGEINLQKDMLVVAEASNGSEAVAAYRMHRPT